MGVVLAVKNLEITHILSVVQTVLNELRYNINTWSLRKSHILSRLAL